MIARVLFFAILMATAAGGAQAALNTGMGPPGTNFSCDVNTQQCTCTGVETGADCKAMYKNCPDSGLLCTVGPNPHCTCTMSRRKPPRVRSPVTSPLTR
jgi:hypothetical protein